MTNVISAHDGRHCLTRVSARNTGGVMNPWNQTEEKATMNASQKVTAAAMALVITLTGAIFVTAPATLSGFSQAHFARGSDFQRISPRSTPRQPTPGSR